MLFPDHGGCHGVFSHHARVAARGGVAGVSLAIARSIARLANVPDAKRARIRGNQTDIDGISFVTDIE